MQPNQNLRCFASMSMSHVRVCSPCAFCCCCCCWIWLGKQRKWIASKWFCFFFLIKSAFAHVGSHFLVVNLCVTLNSLCISHILPIYSTSTLTSLNRSVGRVGKIQRAKRNHYLSFSHTQRQTDAQTPQTTFKRWEKKTKHTNHDSITWVIR